MRYDEAFKTTAICLARSGDKSIAQTARDLGVNVPSIYNWMKMMKQPPIPKHDDALKTSAELIEELNHLRQENLRLKEERKILKKAVTFLPRRNKSNEL